MPIALILPSCHYFVILLLITFIWFTSAGWLSSYALVRLFLVQFFDMLGGVLPPLDPEKVLPPLDEFLITVIPSPEGKKCPSNFFWEICSYR